MTFLLLYIFPKFDAVRIELYDILIALEMGITPRECEILIILHLGIANF